MTAVSDPEAVKKMNLSCFQMILLDVMMPGTDGFSLCREIRDKVDCPILFVTAKTGEKELMTGLGIGGDDISQSHLESGNFAQEWQLI